MKRLVSVLACLGALIIVNPVKGDLVFTDFSSTEGLQLNSYSRVVNDTLRLTNAATFSSGSMFSRDLLQLGANSSFSTYFQFRISSSGGIGDGDGAGADGLVFVVQTQGNNVGGAGQSLGYGGISRSLGVEFDTYNNGPRATEPNGNHVGFDLNGSVESSVVALESVRFNNSQIWNAWIDYNGLSNQLDARWSQSTARPDTPMLSSLVDLPSILGQNEAYVGFTAATGNGYGFHDLISWEFRGEFRPVSTVPEPNSIVLLVAGLGVIAARRLRSFPGNI